MTDADVDRLIADGLFKDADDIQRHINAFKCLQESSLLKTLQDDSLSADEIKAHLLSSIVYLRMMAGTDVR